MDIKLVCDNLGEVLSYNLTKDEVSGMTSLHHTSQTRTKHECFTGKLSKTVGGTATAMWT